MCLSLSPGVKSPGHWAEISQNVSKFGFWFRSGLWWFNLGSMNKSFNGLWESFLALPLICFQTSGAALLVCVRVSLQGCYAPPERIYLKMEPDVWETVWTLLLFNWGLHEVYTIPVLWDTEPFHQDTVNLDFQKVQDQPPQCAQKMTFSQNFSSYRLTSILLNARTLNVSSSFCSLWASGLFSPDLLQLFLLFTQLCNTLKEFPSQNHRQKKS